MRKSRQILETVLDGRDSRGNLSGKGKDERERVTAAGFKEVVRAVDRLTRAVEDLGGRGRGR